MLKAALVVAASLLGAGSAAAMDPSEHLKLCLSAEGRPACEKERAAFLRTYGQAVRGDYQAQRNVAYMLKRGHADVVLPDPVRACAWRLLIVASGSPRVDGTDTGNLKVDCGALSTADRASADIEARALAARVRVGSPPAAASNRGVSRKAPLDSTAQPL